MMQLILLATAYLTAMVLGALAFKDGKESREMFKQIMEDEKV